MLMSIYYDGQAPATTAYYGYCGFYLVRPCT
jgi:hypothetical protein